MFIIIPTASFYYIINICHLFLSIYLNNSQKKDMDEIELWSPEDDEMLENLEEKYGSNWSRISECIPGRSAISCALRRSFLHRLFTPEEDEMLQNLITKHGHNWSLISNSIPDRSAKTCELRFKSLNMPFTLEEDEMLQNLIDKYGDNWSLISKSTPGRSAAECELRWLYYRAYYGRPLFMPEEDETNEDTTIVSLMNVTNTGGLDE